jgi:hypothetical protein
MPTVETHGNAERKNGTTTYSVENRMELQTQRLAYDEDHGDSGIIILRLAQTLSVLISGGKKKE